MRIRVPSWRPELGCGYASQCQYVGIRVPVSICGDTRPKLASRIVGVDTRPSVNMCQFCVKLCEYVCICVNIVSICVYLCGDTRPEWRFVGICVFWCILGYFYGFGPF